MIKRDGGISFVKVVLYGDHWVLIVQNFLGFVYPTLVLYIVIFDFKEFVSSCNHHWSCAWRDEEFFIMIEMNKPLIMRMIIMISERLDLILFVLALTPWTKCLIFHNAAAALMEEINCCEISLISQKFSSGVSQHSFEFALILVIYV